MALVADCPKCNGARCMACGQKGWVYLIRSLEGDILYGINEWLKRREERKRNVSV